MACLQSYVSILYLRVPPEFRIILRGRDVEHHNIVNDMMHTDQITYRPKEGPGGQSNFANVCFFHNLVIPPIDFFLQFLKYNNIWLCVCNFLQQMSAVVTIGFVKDAKHHVDVQGFNVYHKNRLIKVSLSFKLILPFVSVSFFFLYLTPFHFVLSAILEDMERSRKSRSWDHRYRYFAGRSIIIYDWLFYSEV